MSLTKTSRALPRAAALLVLFATLFAAGSAAAQGDRIPLTLEDAVARALKKNEALRIERAAVDAAEAGVSGAKGAYDPLLGLNAGWNRTTPPVNSSFSGAPPGRSPPPTRWPRRGPRWCSSCPAAAR